MNVHKKTKKTEYHESTEVLLCLISLIPGTGDTYMHAPKNRNSPGTLLEPFPVGLQIWANLTVVFQLSSGC